MKKGQKMRSQAKAKHVHLKLDNNIDNFIIDYEKLNEYQSGEVFLYKSEYKGT